MTIAVNTIMYEISKLHLELTSYCNANCPGCPRNFYGLPFNGGYIERHLTLEDAQKIFKNNFLKQITFIHINGNFGDFVMSPYGLDIVKWILSENPDIHIKISTNASAQNAEYWTELGTLGVTVMFDIDGLEETHSIYRQGTDFNKVIRNAKTYIAAGGRAGVKFLRFDHNKDDEDKVMELTKALGFTASKVVDNNRGHLPVFKQDGSKVRDIDYNEDSLLANVTLSEMETFKQFDVTQILLSDITNGKQCTPIECKVKKVGSIYISSLGDVYPCCWLGFEPKTYKSAYHHAANKQFNKLISNNNAIVNDLESCIAWYDRVEETFTKESFEAGRLVICQDTCGGNI